MGEYIETIHMINAVQGRRLAVVLVAVASACALGDPAMLVHGRPIDVVNARMSAYNAHDMTAFLATYSPDVAIYRYPDQLLGRGHAHLERLFGALFTARTVNVDVTTQIERQEFVINDERVQYGDVPVRYVSIYEVKDGLIVSVRFVGADPR